MVRVWLGLGSNKGDRKRYLEQAIHEISKVACIEKISAFYETEPVGMEPTDSFYNMVIEISTDLLPSDLLKRMNSIELLLGRKSDTHLQPREIDIDIELYDSYIYRDSFIEVPHPELHKRKFVLAPMVEIASDVIHPIFRKSVNILFTECDDRHTVIRVETINRTE